MWTYIYLFEFVFLFPFLKPLSVMHIIRGYHDCLDFVIRGFLEKFCFSFMLCLILIIFWHFAACWSVGTHGEAQAIGADIEISRARIKDNYLLFNQKDVRPTCPQSYPSVWCCCYSWRQISGWEGSRVGSVPDWEVSDSCSDWCCSSRTGYQGHQVGDYLVYSHFFNVLWYCILCYNYFLRSKVWGLQ